MTGHTALYARVSPDDQSLARQKAETWNYATKTLDVAAGEIEVYEDTGTDRDTQWDGYQKLMTDVRAGEVPNVRPSIAGSDRGEPSEMSPHPFCHSITFRMIRREDKCLEDVMLQLRHSSI